MSKKFFTKYARFIVPVLIIGMLFSFIMICMVAFCCCGLASCCADGIEYVKESETTIRSTSEMQSLRRVQNTDYHQPVDTALEFTNDTIDEIE